MVQRKLGDVGRRIGLVRWSHDGEAWIPEIVVGIVVDHTDGIWQLALDGEIRALNESDWSLYQP